MIERSNVLEQIIPADYIRQSNLIESVDSTYEDFASSLAWKFLMAQPRLSSSVVLEVHRIITLNSLRPAEAGHLRRIQVYVGNHVPPTPYTASQQFMEWCRDMAGWRKLDPKAMHVRFETIHPFVDGNGRTGRMLMWWHEQKLGRVPTLIEFDKRGEYYKWFTEAQDAQE